MITEMRNTHERHGLILARKRLGLSQAEAGLQIGRSGQAVSDFEHGRGGVHGPSYALLDELCHAYEALRVERGIDGDFRIEVLCPDLFTAVAA